MTDFTVNGTTYSDADISGTNPGGMGAGGFRTNWAPMINNALIDFGLKQSAAAGSVTAAAAQATAAAASAATAINAPGTSATTTSSLTVGIGSISLTLAQTGKAFPIGGSVKIADSVTPSNWMHGDIIAFNSGTGAMTVNVSTLSGSGSVAAWTVSISGPAAPNKIVRSARSSASHPTLIIGDNGQLIDATAGTYTQDLTAAASLGNGWFCYVVNSGSGFVTLDPNGAETVTVNGAALASWVLWPREMGILRCDGVGFSYACIQKGEITQTVGSAVASLTFATGLAYRRRLSLSIGNYAASSSGALSLRPNGVTYADRFGGIRFTNSAVFPSSNVTGGGTIISGSVQANATGINCGFVDVSLDIDSVSVKASSEALYMDAAPSSATEYNSMVWLSSNEATVTSLVLVPTAGNITGGTFILREL